MHPSLVVLDDALKTLDYIWKVREWVPANAEEEQTAISEMKALTTVQLVGLGSLLRILEIRKLTAAPDESSPIGIYTTVAQLLASFGVLQSVCSLADLQSRLVITPVEVLAHMKMPSSLDWVAELTQDSPLSVTGAQ